MPPRHLTRSLAAISAASVTALVPVLVATPASAAGDLYVGTSGSNANPGTLALPLATVQAAVDKATPGTTIRILPGTYYGKILIKKGGTATAPIRITANEPDSVLLTYNSKPQPCNNSQPAADRTITITQGADYWEIDGVSIHNGIWIAGQKSNIAYSWLTKSVNNLDWATRRKVPGHGTFDPSASRTSAIPYLRTVTATPDLDSSDGIKVLNNTMTGRGVYGALTSYGTISGNKISSIPCGIGPGIWLMTFSNGWTITNNDVSDIAVSAAAHYMQEGIRLGSAADYNLVTANNVHDLLGDGRGYNTDVDSSWNTFSRNQASNVAIGFNEQMSGWGNTWEYNTVTNYRTYGFGFRLMDAKLPLPSMSSSSNMSIVRCNITSGPVGKAKALGVGGMMNARFTGNNMPLTWISGNASTYWSTYDNRWNGSTVLPGRNPAYDPTGC